MGYTESEAEKCITYDAQGGRTGSPHHPGLSSVNLPSGRRNKQNKASVTTAKGKMQAA